MALARRGWLPILLLVCVVGPVGGLVLVAPPLVAGAQRAPSASARDSSPSRAAARPAQGATGVSPTLGCAPAWNPVPSANRGPGHNTLRGLAVLGANDAWAVGFADSPVFVEQTLIEHWDGAAWTVVPSPNRGQNANALHAVAGVAANDVWAVGTALDGPGFQTLILHWDGAAWTVVPSPNVGAYLNNQLYAVTARAANDVWAVGSAGRGTLVLHWDGAAWTVVSSPGPSRDGNELRAVVAIAANDVWAAGSYADNGQHFTLITHWDGLAWTVVPSPNVAVDHNYLTGLTAVSATDAWAIGYTVNFANQSEPLALHWDGTAWTIVATPAPGNYPLLRAVTALAANDVWAVGVFRNSVGLRTLFAHWDGTAWDVVPSANAGAGDNDPYAVAAGPGGELWAAGAYLGAAGMEQTLVDVYTAQCFSPTPTEIPPPSETPTPSPVPSSPTRTRTPGPTPTPGCTGWQRVPSPNEPGARRTKFTAVRSWGRNDAWAVGDYNILHYQTFIARWDGTQWTRVPSPNPGLDHDNLYDVDGVASNDVWAVGGYNDWGSPTRPLILHWDGAAWNWVPLVAPDDTSLHAVAAVAANDVWAVGSGVWHWDGSQWNVVPAPGVGYLNGIAARAANDIWATGYYTSPGGRQRTLVEHWDGTAWAVVPSPNGIPGFLGETLNAVAVAGANDVWAGGSIMAHWNGTSWGVVPAPAGGITGLAVVATGDSWAAYGGLLHWDGSQWSIAPHAGGLANGLFAGAPDDVWAVGNLGVDTLIERYSGPCATATPVASATAKVTVTSTPTRTATAPPSRTPSPTTPPGASPTPTYCALRFTDVDQNHPFYAYIHCLACRGVISGYADGTFRPGNSVTRGQLAKILANSAGLGNAIPSTQQTFADVPAAEPFWLFIERLAGTGAINGYACGGPGEPCDPQQRPYFHPGAPATRGQIAKIAAEAAGLSDPVPPAQQTFADVPPGNPFRLWIERLAGRGIISGYTCGGPGEPCDGQHRPYFRWGRDTTRGQLAKIATHTFFPTCVPQR